MKTLLILTGSTTALTTGILTGQGEILVAAIWPTVTALGTLILLALAITLLRLRRDLRAEAEHQNQLGN